MPIILHHHSKSHVTFDSQTGFIRFPTKILETLVEKTQMGMASGRSMELVPPTPLLFESSVIEVSIHKANASVRRELDHFLSAAISVGEQLTSSENVLIICTCQESKVPLLHWSEESAAEKDRLLFSFSNFSAAFCDHFRSLGYWADFADPASGLLMNSPGQKIWPEVQAMERLRGYKKSTAGACHILLHPQWQSRIYPGTLFTNAPEIEVRKKLGIY
jgi:hypothetical protein